MLNEVGISRENNFDLIRLIAALQVAVGHGMRRMDVQPNSFFEFLSLFNGVIIFFVVSGFLITSSFDRNSSVKNYLRNRYLRIYPALYVNFAICIALMFIFGTISINTFTKPTFLFWCFGYNTLFQFYTPDYIRWFGEGAPNGALWTIPVEFVFYLILPIIIGAAYYLSKKYNWRVLKTVVLSLFLWLIASAVANSLYYVSAANDDITLVQKLFGVTVIPFLWNFLLGGILYYLWKYVRKLFEGKFVFWLMAFLTACYVLNIHPSYKVGGNFIANILLCLMTISAAFTKPKLGKILHSYDISYGIYIYHVLVINVFVLTGHKGEIGYLGLMIVVTIILGILSWVLVEKKALALKNKKI